MKVSRLQSVLSIMVVGVFLAVTAIIALTPVIGGYPSDSYTEHLKTFSTIYSGIVGLIVGFFFGRKAES
jgi:branched-subunit amino acid permease